VAAEVLGFERDETLTLGRAVAGLNAYSKGVSLGLFQPTTKEVKEQRRKMRKEETVTVDLLQRDVAAKHTDEGGRFALVMGEQNLASLRREGMGDRTFRKQDHSSQGEYVLSMMKIRISTTSHKGTHGIDWNEGLPGSHLFPCDNLI
jgi:hypothetical protein